MKKLIRTTAVSILLFAVNSVGYCQSDLFGEPGGESGSKRSLDDVRAELKKKSTEATPGGSGYGSGAGGGMAMGSGGSGGGLGMSGGPGMGSGMPGAGMAGAGMAGAGMAGAGMAGAGMAGAGMAGAGMAGAGSGAGMMGGGMMGSEGGGGMGLGSNALSEKQQLTQMIQKLRGRLESTKFKRETVEKQLRFALQQYFTADLEERVKEFDQVKAKVLDMEAKLQRRLDREAEIVELQFNQMLHKADGLDFSVPVGSSLGMGLGGDAGGDLGAAGDGMGSMSGGLGGMSMGGGKSGGNEELADSSEIGYDISFGLTKFNRLDRTDLDATDPLTSYAESVNGFFSDANSNPEKMKAILQAFHVFHERFNHFPRSENRITNANPPHSWRVAILPLIGQGELYREYRFDQPWDSQDNLKVAEKMPDIYRSQPGKSDNTATAFVMLVGAGAFDSGNQPAQFASITDGTSNTIAIIQSKSEVVWTKPEDLKYSTKAALPSLAEERLVGFADGVVQMLSKIEDARFRAFITRAGGESVSLP